MKSEKLTSILRRRQKPLYVGLTSYHFPGKFSLGQIFDPQETQAGAQDMLGDLFYEDDPVVILRLEEDGEEIRVTDATQSVYDAISAWHDEYYKHEPESEVPELPPLRELIVSEKLFYQLALWGDGEWGSLSDITNDEIEAIEEAVSYAQQYETDKSPITGVLLSLEQVNKNWKVLDITPETWGAKPEVSDDLTV